MGRIAGASADRSAPTKMGKSTRWTHQVVARILKRGYRARADIAGAIGKNDDATAPAAA